ncbi:hypothetical protein [Methyloglobulus sp.]|uniref:hypothetical protein n=1 Tax=Methyloglobulus sp. TaxID=2518622 RepID=UPI0017B8822D|nr:hypothetical protein [Methyloglobulus sp.]
MNLNVTDLRIQLRRSPMNQQSASNTKDDRRKTNDRRILAPEPNGNGSNIQRIWLTPGERTLIEDIYFLNAEDFGG